MTEQENISPKYTLGETVNGYLMRQGNMNRKYFSKYFQIAQDIYERLYANLMPTTISKYVQVFPAVDGDLYPYIEKPYGMSRFFGVSVTNKNNELLAVYQNDKLNVFTKPPVQKSGCGCVSTDLCDCIDNLQVVITEKFVLDGIAYYEKTWVKCCDNGDVLQYSETPVLNGTCSIWLLTGSILGPATFSYTKCDGEVVRSEPIDDTGIQVCISDNAPIIITSGTGTKGRISSCDSPGQVTVLTSYKNLGRLATKDCGCPIESDENKDIIFNKCGCFLSAKPKCCKVWYDKSRVECTGEMKWSECGTKLYLKDVKDDGGFAIIHYQLDPVNCSSEILIDSFARWPIWYGMDFESNVFNPRSNPKGLREMERRYTKAINEYFEYLNPIGERIFDIPTAEIKW